MSTFEIKYDINDPKSRTKAIRDIKKYIGSGKQWENLLIIVSAAVAAGYTLSRIEFMCSLVGIQGYPVNALVKHICEVLKCSLPKGLDGEAVDDKAANDKGAETGD